MLQHIQRTGREPQSSTLLPPYPSFFSLLAPGLNPILRLNVSGPRLPKIYEVDVTVGEVRVVWKPEKNHPYNHARVCPRSRGKVTVIFQQPGVLHKL